MVTRRVVLVCGPPGAGKTTYARSLGLPVYDSDDEQWTSERHFRSAIEQLASQANAQAAVIRSGATRTARSKASLAIGATETVILDVDEATCVERVKARGGDMRRDIGGIKGWWQRYEPDLATDLTTSESW